VNGSKDAKRNYEDKWEGNLIYVGDDGYLKKKKENMTSWCNILTLWKNSHFRHLF
jgi:hypothetical protein